jgi:hypothetical protein
MKVEMGPYPKKGRRKIKVRIHKYDLWSLDDTFAHIILPAMKKYKKKIRGVPSCMFENADDERWEEAEKKWEDILDCIIWSMEETINEKNDPGGLEKMKRTVVKDKDGSKSVQFSWENEADREEYRKNRKEYDERLQKGYDLFGKHFSHFWN